MEKERLELNRRDREMLKVLDAVARGDCTQESAGRLLQISSRQVRRLLRRLEREGDKAVIHGLRGRASNRRLDQSLRKACLRRYRESYSDFGPTFAAEQLARRDNLQVSDETLRRWLIAESLWKARREGCRHRAHRMRRLCLGELVQADGSEHDWLEGRGPRMVLVGIIDDATGRIFCRFYTVETTEAYMDLLRRYIKKFGRPKQWYCDRDSIFRSEDRYGQPGQTQFGRALKELEIELILANSPQAKGRIERLWNTLQDRWVKMFRLDGICTMEQANALLEARLLADHNRRFAKKPQSPLDAHQGRIPAEQLDAILSIQQQRTVANDYTIRAENRHYQLHPPIYPGQRGGQVRIEQRLDGTMKIRFKDRYLSFSEISTAASGALPPNPRSLSHLHVSEDKKEDGRAQVQTGHSSAHKSAGRSGRTSALPCPAVGPKSVEKLKASPKRRAWSNFVFGRSLEAIRQGKRPSQPDISTLAK